MQPGERGGNKCGPSRKINFSTSWGASCAVILMTKMRGEGKKGKNDRRLYIHTSTFTHLHCHGCVACSWALSCWSFANSGKTSSSVGVQYSIFILLGAANAPLCAPDICCWPASVQLIYKGVLLRCLLQLETKLMRVVRLNRNDEAGGCETKTMRWKELNRFVELRGTTQSQRTLYMQIPCNILLM